MKNPVWDSLYNIRRILYSDLNAPEKLVLISVATDCEFDEKSEIFISDTPLSTLIRNSNLDENLFKTILGNLIQSGVISRNDKDKLEFNFHSSLTLFQHKYNSPNLEK